MLRYYFGLEPDGKILIGTAVDLPPEYTVEGTEQVWFNQERAFYINGQWIIYDPLTVSALPATTVGQAVTVTAVLPADTPDTKVIFEVLGSSAPIAVTVTNGQASQDFVFDAPGTYTIEARSRHHGAARAEVVVS